jgi:hypothetical protein
MGRGNAFNGGTTDMAAGVAVTLAISAAALFGAASEALAADLVVEVIDDKRNPVDGADVQLEPVSGGRGVKTRASASGRYVFLDVPPGRYRLTCGGPSSREITVGTSVDKVKCQR